MFDKAITVRVVGEAVAVDIRPACSPICHQIDFRIGPVREQLLVGDKECGMATLQLKDTQQCELGVEVRDKKGNLTNDQLDGPPTWRSSDENVATVVPSADSMSATVVAGNPGTAQINVDAVNEGQQFVGTLDLLVVGGDAVSIGITTGTPGDQP